MTKRTLATVGLISLSPIAFALGWALKPGEADSSAGTRSSGGVSSVSAVTGLKGAGHHAAGTGPGAAGQGPAGTSAGSVALTAESIAALGEQFRSSRDPLAKREAFAKLLAGLTVENALEIRKQIEHLDSESPEFKDFHFAWGKIGGMEAVMHGAGTDKSDMGPTMAGWASANPDAARAWMESLPEKSDKPPRRSQMKEALVEGLVVASPALAVDFVASLKAAGDPQARRMMGLVTDRMLQSAGPAGAAAWATSLPEGELRGNALFDVARAQVRSDARAAAAWGTSLARDTNATSVIHGISVELGSRNGPAAVKWLDSLGGDQSGHYGAAVAGWAKADPMAASQYIASMPASGNRDSAIGGLVYSHRWEDPSAAISWANEIRDSQRRVDALTQAAEAYVKKDPAGAAAWLPGSGLPPATQQRLMGNGK